MSLAFSFYSYSIDGSGYANRCPIYVTSTFGPSSSRAAPRRFLRFASLAASQPPSLRFCRRRFASDGLRLGSPFWPSPSSCHPSGSRHSQVKFTSSLICLFQFDFQSLSSFSSQLITRTFLLQAPPLLFQTELKIDLCIPQPQVSVRVCQNRVSLEGRHRYW